MINSETSKNKSATFNVKLRGKKTRENNFRFKRDRKKNKPLTYTPSNTHKTHNPTLSQPNPQPDPNPCPHLLLRIAPVLETHLAVVHPRGHRGGRPELPAEPGADGAVVGRRQGVSRRREAPSGAEGGAPVLKCHVGEGGRGGGQRERGID